MDKYQTIALLFTAYLGYQIGPRIKQIRALLNQSPDKQREFYGKARGNLEAYHNALVDFKDHGYKASVGSQEPWEAFYVFLEDPNFFLSNIIKNATSHLKVYYKERIKLKENQISNGDKLKAEGEEIKYQQGEVNEEDDHDLGPIDFF